MMTERKGTAPEGVVLEILGIPHSALLVDRSCYLGDLL